MIYTDGTHVITDQVDLTELHEFAKNKLGFPLRWFQDKPGRPHYDTITLSKKLAALAGGARSVTSRRIVEILREREMKASAVNSTSALQAMIRQIEGMNFRPNFARVFTAGRVHDIDLSNVRPEELRLIFSNEPAPADLRIAEEMEASVQQLAAAFNVPVELTDPTQPHESRSPTNVELHLLPQYAGKTCHLCGRAYPDTVLNIEAVIHHHAKAYTCTDTKDCRRARKRRRLR